MLVSLRCMSGHRCFAGLLGARDGQLLVGAIEQLVDGCDLLPAPDLPPGSVGCDLLLQGALGRFRRGCRLVLAPGVYRTGGDEPGQLLVGPVAVRAAVPGLDPGQLPLLLHVGQALPLLVRQLVLTLLWLGFVLALVVDGGRPGACRAGPDGVGAIRRRHDNRGRGRRFVEQVETIASGRDCPRYRAKASTARSRRSSSVRASPSRARVSSLSMTASGSHRWLAFLPRVRPGYVANALAPYSYSRLVSHVMPYKAAIVIAYPRDRAPEATWSGVSHADTRAPHPPPPAVHPADDIPRGGPGRRRSPADEVLDVRPPKGPSASRHPGWDGPAEKRGVRARGLLPARMTACHT